MLMMLMLVFGVCVASASVSSSAIVSASKAPAKSPGELCATVPGLVSQQIRVCQAHPNVMYAVSEGARQGINECQRQFKHERWNCTPEGDESVFGHTLQRGECRWC